MWTAEAIGRIGVSMNINVLVKYLVAFIVGFAICYIFCPRTRTVTEYKDKIIQGEVKTVTQTELVYVPKSTVVSADGTTSLEKTDLDINIPKTELHVRINGQSALISKDDTEAYIFEKNKVQVQQQSTASINIAVPIVDKTRRWAVGLGYGNNGLAGTLDFPLYKTAVAGWLYTDRKTNTVGIKVNF